MSFSIRAPVLALLLAPGVILAGLAVGARSHPAGPITVRSQSVLLRAERGVSPRRVREVAAEVARLRRGVGRDFEVHPGRLRVEMYATHASFARALWLEQSARPQTAWDDSGAIVRGTLLLGPLPAAYLRHNLAHVYTEWVIDGLTGNRSDALPSDPWLYDGLAEYEAYRYAPAGLPCASQSAPPLDVTGIRSARRWLAVRAGPLGALEYCLAYKRVRRLVGGSLDCLVRALHHEPWPAVVAYVMRDHG